MNDRRIVIGLSAAAAILVIVVVVLLVLVLSDDDGDDEAQVESETTETASPTATATEDGDSDEDDDDSTATPTGTAEGPAPTALDAVGQFIENTGQEFAGLCEEADLEEDVGKVCASERGMSGDQIAYQVGATFSEFSDVFFVRPEGGGFVVDHIEPAPCQGQLPCPPPVGATVEIVADGCVNARAQPSITAAINECVDGGTAATLSDGPVDADARLWVELEGLGWVSSSFISCTEGCE
jgi:hypothetical protein